MTSHQNYLDNSNFKKLVPYVFLIWILDIIFTIIIKIGLEGEFSPGVHGASLLSHQIRILIRIGIAFCMAGIILYVVKHYTSKDLWLTGLLWLTLVLIFEWGGSLIIGRTVEDILIGWNIFQGYFWVYFLIAVFVSPFVMGTFVIPKILKTKN
jgi:hypothetical protein